VADLDRVRSVIVDDSDGFVSLVSRQLVTDGFDMVGAAADRDQGLRLVYDLCPDVALVDLYLGAGNGLELIADIVCSGLADEMFVILISSCAADDLRELFECSVADGYLSKLEMSGDAVRSILRGNGHGANGHSRNGRDHIVGDGSA
jgi:DNA-binding NarL/FixJ family response regulator